MVATYRGSDANPKERFVHHQAGASGDGGSSYIDLVAFRERDVDDGWTGDPDGTIDERIYYCQNQHADVVALVTDAGAQREMARYSAYGVPIGYPMGDANSDGIANATDRTTIQGWINTSAYDVRGDVDLDGDVDLTDKSTVQAQGVVTLGRGALSAASVRNQRGVAGYVAAGYEPSTYLIRHRVFPSELGVWASRDPLGFVESTSVYSYVHQCPITLADDNGLQSVLPGGCVSGGGIPVGMVGSHCIPLWLLYAMYEQPAPPPPPPPPVDPCAEACRKWQESNENSHPPAPGMTICAPDGTVCPCVATNEQLRRFLMTDTGFGHALAGAQAGGAPSNGAVSVMRKCVKEHEEYHRDNHSAPCTEEQRKRGASPGYARPNGKKIDYDTAEREASQVGKKCLENTSCAVDSNCWAYRNAMIERSARKIKGLGG